MSDILGSARVKKLGQLGILTKRKVLLTVIKLRNFVGWVERSETHQLIENYNN